MSNKFQRWVVGELMKPVVLAGSILEKLCEPLLKPMASRSSLAREARFATEIRQHLSFLFDEYGGAIVPDETVTYPRPFDFASVIVAVDDLLFRFFRGRGDLRVWVAPKRAPNDWDELPVVLAMVDAREWSEPREFFCFWMMCSVG